MMTGCVSGMTMAWKTSWLSIRLNAGYATAGGADAERGMRRAKR